MKTVRRTFGSGGTATVLSLSTEDLARPPQVREAFDEILSVLGQRAVIVDLSLVARLTSMGLSALSAGADAAREHSARFAIAGVRPEVRRLVDTLSPDGGGGRIEIAEDVESALRTLDEEPGNA
jgi:anti-anti-sigma regulatory factor